MPKFLVDEMLKSLCRWLRIFGITAYYAGDFVKEKGGWVWRPDDSPRGKKRRGGPGDDDLVKIARKEKLVFLTRDEELGRRAADYAETILFKTDSLDDQLLLLAEKYKFRVSKIEKRTVCPHCMGKLERVPKDSIREMVFPRVFQQNRFFWQCSRCSQVFWKGSHWREIAKKMEKLKMLGN